MENRPVVKFKKLHPDAKLPQYQSDGAAGMDLYAIEGGRLDPQERLVVRTGLAIEVPPGYEAQVRSRSGLAADAGVVVANSPGTIDSDYRGEVKVILLNTGNVPRGPEAGERIAQLVIAPVAKAIVELVAELSPTGRGNGGFGSTGTK